MVLSVGFVKETLDEGMRLRAGAVGDMSMGILFFLGLVVVIIMLFSTILFILILRYHYTSRRLIFFFLLLL
jgi:hypothetical protein